MATSRTLRAIGPAVSWLAEIGIITERLTSPTVGFKPTSEQQDEGDVIEPSVSLPMAPAQ